MNIYTIRDKVAGYYMPIFITRNHGQASRMFIQSLGHQFPHRADFDLFHLGSFDDDAGTVTSIEPHRVLAGLSIAADMDPRAPEALPQISANLSPAEKYGASKDTHDINGKML